VTVPPIGVVVLPPGPATLAGVKTLLKVTTTADDDLITAAVDGTNAYVAELPARWLYVPPIDPADPPTLAWPADTILGATMLAGRLYRRRNSPAGVEAFSDLGGAVYVQRNDPDIALLLKTGAYARPMVG
jgi:hypothetical protein